jgi:hypothetical protein
LQAYPKKKFGPQKYLEQGSKRNPNKSKSETRTYINCPYSEKEAVKQKGAKWDTGAKKWYIPEGVSSDGFEKWLGK